MKILLTASGLAALSMSAQAALINFDAVTPRATVDGFYNGGTDSLGGSGPNYGVYFGPAGTWQVLGGYGETSEPFFAYSATGTSYVDVNPGFTSLSFTYGASSRTTVSIFSGLDGTGSLLASSLLPADNPYAFSPASLSFSGTAYSVVVSGVSSGFGWDDVNLAIAPEPSTYLAGALTLLPIGLQSIRRLRKPRQQS